MRFIILMLIAAMAGSACSREECLENKNALPQVGFYDSAYPDQKISLDSTAIYAEGVPGDKLILDSLSKASSLTIPFNLDSDTTKYIFEYIRKDLFEAGIRDTLNIIYTRTPYFVSSACGVSYRMLITDLTSTHFLIDSVSAPQALITNVALQNIHVYFRVAHPEDDPENPEDEPETPDNQEEI